MFCVGLHVIVTMSVTSDITSLDAETTERTSPMTVLGAACRMWRITRTKWRPVLLLCIVVFSFSFLRMLVINDRIIPKPAAEFHQGKLHILPHSPERITDNSPILRFVPTKQEVDPLAHAINEHKKSCPLIVRPAESGIKYRNGYWQMFVDGADEIFAITAFYDDRPIVGLLPFVRLHVVDKTTAALYCQVWYPGYDHPFVTPVIMTSTGRGENIDKVKYKQNLYSCAMPVSYPLPSHVSVATGTCRNSSIYLQVTVSNRADWQHEFGVCVAIAFGSIPTNAFVEWIEFHRLLGVTEINIYDGNLSPNMSSLLQYYSNDGVLRVYSMPPPVMDFTKKGVKLSSPASLNDCMLRNMYRYRYMIVVDFDELILPVHAHNYREMLQEIDSSHKLDKSWISYTFRNVYHFKHFAEDNSQPSYLSTMRRRESAKPSGYLYAPKSFIDPRTCLSVFNHYCWRKFPSTPKPWTIDVNTSVAMSHHYRNCHFSKDKCDIFSKEAQRDDTILRYQNALDDKVKSVLTDLKVYIKKSENIT